MSFSAKISLAERKKDDGTRLVYLVCYIDRMRVRVSLGFCVREEDFNGRAQRMRNHPNKNDFDTEFIAAIAKAHGIASKFRQKNITLTPDAFRKEYKDPTEEMDFIKFFETELELKRPSLVHNTYKQHMTVLTKLRSFKSKIKFNEISIELMQRFRNKILKRDDGQPMGPATVEKLMKIVKQYLNDARRKGHSFKDPFEVIKIKSFKSNRLGLSQEEVDKLDKYYESADCKPHHRKLLRYFLFSCYTGLRISDISAITWNNVHDNLLIFIPQKTRYKQNTTTVPLLEKEKKYLPEFKPGNQPIFETFADQVSNRYLKEIATHVGIRKKVTYHTSRHTFGSLFAEGGDIVALQKMMGHSDIKTTMGYVHTSVKSLVDAKTLRFGSRTKSPDNEHPTAEGRL